MNKQELKKALRDLSIIELLEVLEELMNEALQVMANEISGLFNDKEIIK